MVTNEKPAEKAILSLRVAQSLMERGFNLIRVEQSYKHRGKLAFIFEYCEGIDEELAKFSRVRQAE